MCCPCPIDIIILMPACRLAMINALTACWPCPSFDYFRGILSNIILILSVGLHLTSLIQSYLLCEQKGN